MLLRMDDTELLDRLRLIRTNHISLLPASCYCGAMARLPRFRRYPSYLQKGTKLCPCDTAEKELQLSAMPELNCFVMVRNTILLRCCF